MPITKISTAELKKLSLTILYKKIVSSAKGLNNQEAINRSRFFRYNQINSVKNLFILLIYLNEAL